MNEVKDGLYHVETGLPATDSVTRQAFGLEYGQHARKAALDDKYGQLTSVPLSHAFTRSEIFEIEVEQGRIVKFAARLGQDCKTFAVKQTHTARNGLDLILVLVPSLRDSNNLFVKTLWLQERNDSHGTLDKSKYIPHNP